MKKIVSKEVSFCDKCGKEIYITKCNNCDKEHCWECRKTEGIEYSYSVHSGGGDDGYYCKLCDTELRKTKTDELHNSYLTIQKLQNEFEAFDKDWGNIVKLADEKAKELIAKSSI